MGGFDESDQKAQSWVRAFQEEQQNAPVLGDSKTKQSRTGRRSADPHRPERATVHNV
jgi:hypothetical protein